MGINFSTAKQVDTFFRTECDFFIFSPTLYGTQRLLTNPKRPVIKLLFILHHFHFQWFLKIVFHIIRQLPDIPFEIAKIQTAFA